MKRIYWLTALGLVFTVLAAAINSISTPVLAGEMLPYKGAAYEIVTWEGPHQDCTPGQIKAYIQGGGQGTHFGNYTIMREHCLDLAAGSFEGSFEQTAADGDKIWGTYQVSVQAILEFKEDGSPAVISVAGQWTITSGSGRFATAAGGGSTSGVVSLVTHDGNFESLGWISFSASDGNK